MFKSILSYFFRDRKGELKAQIETLSKLNSHLYDELEANKRDMLDYKLLKLYVNDDEAILELLNLEKKREEFERDQNVSAKYWRERCDALEKESAARKNNIYDIKRQQILNMEQEFGCRQRSQSFYPTAYSEHLHRETVAREKYLALSMMASHNIISPSQLQNSFNLRYENLQK